MTTRASGGVAPRSFRTNRRTLAYRAEKPWSSTRSCQMAIAFRPWVERVGDDLAIDLTGARAGRAGRRRPRRVGGHLLCGGRICRRVGGHPRCGGRIWRRPRPRPTASCPHGNARRLQVLADGFAPDAGASLNLAQRPAQPPQRANVVLLLFGQDVAHARVGTCVPRRRQRLGRQPWWPVFRCRSVAGFGCPPRFGRGSLRRSGPSTSTGCSMSCGRNSVMRSRQENSRIVVRAGDSTRSTGTTTTSSYAHFATSTIIFSSRDPRPMATSDGWGLPLRTRLGRGLRGGDILDRLQSRKRVATIAVSDRGTLGGLTQFATQFGFAGSATSL